MSRKTATITITAEGRDKGKTFLVTEMDAEHGEDWAWRALFAIAKANPDIPTEAIGAGWGVLAMIGLRAVLSAPYAEAKPLLDEMIGCVQSVQESATRPLIASDIEEIATRLQLRDEVFKLHANFSFAETLSTFRSVLSQDPKLPDGNQSDTQTSDPESPS